MKEMNVLIAGSYGMIGSAVTPYLVACGHQLVRLARSAPGPDEVWWDPDAGQIDASGVEGFDGVVNLATAHWPFHWTAKAKEKIRTNRVATYHWGPPCLLLVRLLRPVSEKRSLCPRLVVQCYMST